MERVARRYDASLSDLWDEAGTALIRAAVYFKPQDPAAYRSSQYEAPLPAHKSFRHYAQLAVQRGCWRYVVAPERCRNHDRVLDDLPRTTSLHDLDEKGHHEYGSATKGDRQPRPTPPALLAPSAEEEAIARDAVRRAWILREHAALADARGDGDTTSRLRAAASAADRRARCTGRRSPQSSRSA